MATAVTLLSFTELLGVAGPEVPSWDTHVILYGNTTSLCVLLLTGVMYTSVTEKRYIRCNINATV